MLKTTLLAFVVVLQSSTPAPQPAKPDLICFSPGGDCLEKIADAIDEAKRSVVVQAYSFTSRVVAQALVKAKKRGADVQVIIDHGRVVERSSQAAYLFKAGIKILVDREHRIAHNKIVVIDEEIVVTGSLNLTSEADTRNAENTLILRDKRVIDAYIRNWLRHAQHSEDYNPKKK